MGKSKLWCKISQNFYFWKKLYRTNFVHLLHYIIRVLELDWPTATCECLYGLASVRIIMGKSTLQIAVPHLKVLKTYLVDKGVTALLPNRILISKNLLYFILRLMNVAFSSSCARRPTRNSKTVLTIIMNLKFLCLMNNAYKHQCSQGLQFLKS